MNMSIRFPHLGINLGYVGETVSVFGFEVHDIWNSYDGRNASGACCYHTAGKDDSNQDQNLYLEALIPGVVFGAGRCQSMLYSTALGTFLQKNRQQCIMGSSYRRNGHFMADFLAG